MLSTLEILLPIFGLILAGYVCRKRNVMGPNAASELNRFVVWLALPALLFDTISQASFKDLYRPGFIAAFTIAVAVVFLLTLVWRLFSGRQLADASVDAIAAAYPNTGYIGFPLGMIVFGQASQTPAMIATLIVACVFFAMAIVLIEIGVQSERRPHKLAAKVVKSLLKNPLIVSPIVGGLFAAAHVPIPQSADTFLKLLSNAASPCALVSLGLFLAQPRPSAALRGASIVLTVAKLVIQPAVTWWLAAKVFKLDTEMVDITVVLAALPTGTGPFMLAEFYKREALITSQTILLTTVVSLLTLTGVLTLMAR